MNRQCRTCANLVYGEQRCRALNIKELRESECAAWRPRPIKAECPCKPSFYLCPRRKGRTGCRAGGCWPYEEYRAELDRVRYERRAESDITSVLIEGKQSGKW